eukprot:14149560-Alexandrium_andersonii.AAC.1
MCIRDRSPCASLAVSPCVCANLCYCASARWGRSVHRDWDQCDEGVCVEGDGDDAHADDPIGGNADS